jgi:hypothetical protein
MTPHGPTPGGAADPSDPTAAPADATAGYGDQPDPAAYPDGATAGPGDGTGDGGWSHPVAGAEAVGGSAAPAGDGPVGGSGEATGDGWDGEAEEEMPAELVRLAAAVSALDEVASLPVAEHVQRYDALHGELSDALASIDEV